MTLGSISRLSRNFNSTQHITYLNEDKANGSFYVVYYLCPGICILASVFSICATIYTIFQSADGMVLILCWHVLLATL